MAGSDDIDALLNQLKGPPPKPVAATPTPAAGGADVDPLKSTAAKGGSAATPPVTDDSVDALLAKLGDAGKPPVGKPGGAPLQPAPAPSNADVDQLLAQLGGKPSASAAASMATAQVMRPQATGSAAQLSDIDAILSQLGSRPALPAVGAASAAAHEAQAAASGALTGRADGAKPLPGTRAAREDSDAHQLLPSDEATSDSLEAVLQAMPMSKVHTTRQVKKGVPAQLGLSQEDIDALIAKHGDQAGGEAETMISQDDIDSLVKQLSAATSKVATAAAIRAATAAFARHNAANAGISGLSGNATTVMDMPAPGGQRSTGTTSLTDVRRAVVQSLPPVMMPKELRATRWLLGAAVLLLAICAATTAAMASTIGKLGAALHAAHATPVSIHPEDFSLELKAGMALLAGDEVDAARGVALLDRLKSQTPSREDEVDLVVARHFRAHHAHRQASDRYAAVFERSPRLPSDPAVHLEFAECLADLGDIDQALRRCYILLANEQEFRSPLDDGGRERGETELALAGEAFARAQLLLGRLHGQRLIQPDEDTHGAVGRAEGKAHAESQTHAVGAAPAAHAGHHP